MYAKSTKVCEKNNKKETQHKVSPFTGGIPTDASGVSIVILKFPNLPCNLCLIFIIKATHSRESWANANNFC